MNWAFRFCRRCGLFCTSGSYGETAGDVQLLVETSIEERANRKIQELVAYLATLQIQ